MMISRSAVEKQLNYTIKTTDFPKLGKKIPGKVRDSYVLGDRRVLITSDRLSAFDRVLTTIPFKGHLINGMAAYWFKETADIIPNHIIEYPHPNVFVAKQVEIVPIEVVIRAYLTGSAWRDYEAGKEVSGVKLPAGMKRWQQFEKPLITPSTKAEHGEHDEPISSAEVVRRGIVEKKLWDEICEKALAVFQRGTEKASEHGLILVDTKYEFGLLRNGKTQLLLADEIHTQDSSRYWMLNSYKPDQEPDMLDKEFVRRWLIERGYMGDGEPPAIPDSFRVDIAMKYIEAFQHITGTPFNSEVGPQEEKIRAVLSELI